MITFTNTIRVLAEYGEKIRTLYTSKNIQNGYDPAADLQNITFNVYSNAGNFEIVFNMPDYFKWAENGRLSGKMPPPGSLLKWMQFKNILPSPVKLENGKTVLPTMQSLEYLIRRKIGNEGTKGSHTWEETENEIRNSLIRDVKVAIEKDFKDYINQTYKNRI